MVHFISNPVCFISEMAHLIRAEVNTSEKSCSSGLFDHDDNLVDEIWGFSINGDLLASRLLNGNQEGLRVLLTLRTLTPM